MRPVSQMCRTGRVRRLEHPIDGGARRPSYGGSSTTRSSSVARSDSLGSHRRRIIDEQFDPLTVGLHQVWSPSPAVADSIEPEEIRAVHGTKPSAIEPPASIRQSSSVPNASFAKSDSGLPCPIADSEHGGGVRVPALLSLCSSPASIATNVGRGRFRRSGHHALTIVSHIRGQVLLPPLPGPSRPSLLEHLG